MSPLAETSAQPLDDLHCSNDVLVALMTAREENLAAEHKLVGASRGDHRALPDAWQMQHASGLVSL